MSIDELYSIDVVDYCSQLDLIIPARWNDLHVPVMPTPKDGNSEVLTKDRFTINHNIGQLLHVLIVTDTVQIFGAKLRNLEMKYFGHIFVQDLMENQAFQLHGYLYTLYFLAILGTCFFRFSA
jgi:hypothetical protein